jgi:hypothetical protein
MKPSWESWESNSAEALLSSPRFAATFEELRDAITGTDIPLREVGPFSSRERQKVPKRQRKTKQGVSADRLLPIHQARWNDAIKRSLQGRGWTSQPLAAGIDDVPMSEALLVGDFVKNGIFVEVEFGNAASYFRDLLKFEIANKHGQADVAVLVCARRRTAEHFDSGTTTFESIRRNIEPYLSVLRCPILFVGLDHRDEDADELRRHYDAMYDVATANGVKCHPSSAWFGPEPESF